MEQVLLCKKQIKNQQNTVMKSENEKKEGNNENWNLKKTETT